MQHQLPTIVACFASTLLTAIAGAQIPQTRIIDISGQVSYGFYGDPNNVMLMDSFDGPVRIIGVGWDVGLTAFSPSWLSEATLSFFSQNDGFVISPFVDDTPGMLRTQSVGFADLDGSGSALTVPDDEALFVELFESFDDASVAPDGVWDAGSYIALRYVPADLAEWGVFGQNLSGDVVLLQGNDSQELDTWHPMDSTTSHLSLTPGLVADMTCFTSISTVGTTRMVTIELLTVNDERLGIPGLLFNGEPFQVLQFQFGRGFLDGRINDPRRSGPPSGTFTLLGQGGAALFSGGIGPGFTDDGQNLSLFASVGTPGSDLFAAYYITGCRWEITYPIVNRNGDMNCDGLVDALDADAFCLAINDPATYIATYPGCDIRMADLNGDFLVNAADEPLFCGALSGSPGTPAPGCVTCLAPDVVVVDGDFGTIFADADAVVGTVQDGLDLVAEDGEVRVRPGLYRELVNVGSKPLTLTSDPSDPSQVIISADLDNNGTGDGRPMTINSGGGPGIEIVALTLTDGHATSSTIGGDDGGGMLIEDSNPTIRACIFDSNRADGDGGGIMIRSSNAPVDLPICVFTNNRADNGGAIAIDDAQAVLFGALIGGNAADTGAAQGGAIYTANASVSTFDTCIIADNSALSIGSGIRNGPAGCDMTILSSTITGNGPTQGIFTGNVGASMTIRNTIIANNGSLEINGQFTADVDSSIIPGGYAGLPGVINADPMFNSDGGYSLGAGSPAIDAGDNIAVSTLGAQGDYAGQPRFVDDAGTPDTGTPDPLFPARAIVDIGALEFQLTTPPACPGDANGDLLVNITDLNLVVGNFGSAGSPGSPGDINGDGSVNIIDLNLVLGNFGIDCG